MTQIIRAIDLCCGAGGWACAARGAGLPIRITHAFDRWPEAARLQGFPQDYLFYGSPSAVWKMVAQAIQIDLGRAILKAIVAENET